jgi:hypothetical protein
MSQNRQYFTRSSKVINLESFMMTNDLTVDGKADNNINAQYNISVEEIASLQIIGLSYDNKWVIESTEDETIVKRVLGANPKMGEYNDWTPILIMSLIDEEDSNKKYMKAAFLNKTTDKVALQSSANYSNGLHKYRSYDKDWFVICGRTCAPNNFWEELKRRIVSL